MSTDQDDGKVAASGAPASSMYDGLNPALMCSCGHPRSEHWFRCRGKIAPVAVTTPDGTWASTRCDCTKFTNPANTILAQHPGPLCPCFACFTNATVAAATEEEQPSSAAVPPDARERVAAIVFDAKFSGGERFGITWERVLVMPENRGWATGIRAVYEATDRILAALAASPDARPEDESPTDYRRARGATAPFLTTDELPEVTVRRNRGADARPDETERDGRALAPSEASPSAGDAVDVLLQNRLDHANRLLRYNDGHDPIAMGVRAIAAARAVLIEEVAHAYNVMRSSGDDPTPLALFAQRAYIARLEALVLDGHAEGLRCDGCELVFGDDEGESGDDCWLCAACFAAMRVEARCEGGFCDDEADPFPVQCYKHRTKATAPEGAEEAAQRLTSQSSSADARGREGTTELEQTGEASA